MATLVFTALGTLLGGPLGGALGALAGRQVDALVFAPKSREGPRLAELAVSSSSYGFPLPRLHGRCRVPGQVIWATDLVEHRNRQGNGKGRPATVSYTYSGSFAVALSSCPIEGIGRIWADGKLLRGTAGDLKAGGSLRIYTGHGDQPADPLLVAAEGAANCPAYRGIAYLVFEDLQLADFGNRIPTLSFEVFTSPYPLRLDALIDPAIPDCDAAVPLAGLEGIAVEGSSADLLTMLEPLFPLDCDACDTLLTISPERLQKSPLALPEATVSTQKGEFGGQAGFARTRRKVTSQPIGVLRHYDPDRDYQPGAQRSTGPVSAGNSRTLDLPATIGARAARHLIESAVRRQTWSQQHINWRISQLDPAIRPGTLVTLPSQPGRWLVKGWEWRAGGVELALTRAAPTAPEAFGASDPGRVGSDRDLPAGQTVLYAFELPWDGNPATAAPQLFAAAGSASPGWAGAALFVDQGDGALQPIGMAGRSPATIGTAATVLAPASPLLIDRTCLVEIALLDHRDTLADATLWQLAQGANRALLGSELIQFAKAEPLGEGRWRLRELWRGRGGTEAAIADHSVGERFVLLNGEPTALDAGSFPSPAAFRINAIGLGDMNPVESPIALAGIGSRPLSPVHGWLSQTAEEGCRLGWTRRSRGGWIWHDGSDLPINEQREAYLIDLVAGTEVLARWETAQPNLSIPPVAWAGLSAQAPTGVFEVRQIGDRALSLPLSIPLA
jgi:hypothetical protein